MQGKQLATAIARGHRLIAEDGEQTAFEFLQKAIQQFPDDPEIGLLYATTSLLPNRPQDAVSETLKAIELDPDEPIRLTPAANLLFNMEHRKSTCVCGAGERIGPV